MHGAGWARQGLPRGDSFLLCSFIAYRLISLVFGCVESWMIVSVTSCKRLQVRANNPVENEGHGWEQIFLPEACAKTPDCMYRCAQGKIPTGATGRN